jgi:hypothetical protein
MRTAPERAHRRAVMHFRTGWRRVLWSIALAFTVRATTSVAQAAAPPKPNIVFILVDNIGWGDFGVTGGMTPTPRIDKLANEGTGVDASAFMLGKSKTTGRDSYMVFSPTGELMSVKWKIYKVILRYSEGTEAPIVQPQFPLFYDLSSDPQELWNLWSYQLDSGWMLTPAFRLIGEYEASVKKYPNIKPNQDFKGYPAK